MQIWTPPNLDASTVTGYRSEDITPKIIHNKLAEHNYDLNTITFLYLLTEFLFQGSIHRVGLWKLKEIIIGSTNYISGRIIDTNVLVIQCHFNDENNYKLVPAFTMSSSYNYLVGELDD